MTSVPQLPLPFSYNEQHTFSVYFPGPNREAVSYLQGLAGQSGDFIAVYLWGASATGKSHLLQAVCQQAAAAGHLCAYLPMADAVELSPRIVERFETLDTVCIDDLQLARGHQPWEQALFHLYNRLNECNRKLVVAADARPDRLDFGLEDLRSRLSWGVSFCVKPLSDDDKLALIRQRCAVRSLELPDPVATYLLNRVSRDLADLLLLLEELDRSSLAARRKLTVPFVRELYMAFKKGREAE